MRPKSKRALFDTLIARLPFSDLFLRFYRNHLYSNCLIVLNYHHVVDEKKYLPDWCCIDLNQFKQQLTYLQERFTVVSVADGLSKIKTLKKFDKPLAAITFDDGYLNNYTYAFPVLKAMNLPATIFLATGYIDSDDTIWSCRLNEALFKTTQTQLLWNNRIFPLTNIIDKERAFIQLQVYLKAFANDQLLEECSIIISTLGQNSIQKIDRSSPYRMLDRTAISDMLASGLVDFGAHSKNHVILSQLSGSRQCEEIKQSVNDIREITGRDDILFAYPNGSPGDFDEHSIHCLKESGVQYALTTSPGFNRNSTLPYQLKRIGVGGDWGKGIFAFAVSTGITSNSLP